METKLIECKLIDVPKADGAAQTFAREFVNGLPDSTKFGGPSGPTEEPSRTTLGC